MLYYFKYLCDIIFMYGPRRLIIKYRLNAARMLPANCKMQINRKDRPIRLPSTYG